MERIYSRTEGIDMDNRQKAIQEIKSLFPTDSEFERTNVIGIRLLEEAKRNTNNWRNLPDVTLFEYARLCREEENRQYRESMRKYP